jgi:hypothetical protein
MSALRRTHQVFDDDWTMSSTPSLTGEYQQLSVNTLLCVVSCRSRALALQDPSVGVRPGRSVCAVAEAAPCAHVPMGGHHQPGVCGATSSQGAAVTLQQGAPDAHPSAAGKELGAVGHRLQR